jgi:hypothetical protein
MRSRNDRLKINRCLWGEQNGEINQGNARGNRGIREKLARRKAPIVELACKAPDPGAAELARRKAASD